VQDEVFNWSKTLVQPIVGFGLGRRIIFGFMPARKSNLPVFMPKEVRSIRVPWFIDPGNTDERPMRHPWKMEAKDELVN
jgi:hypothetical protein